MGERELSFTFQWRRNPLLNSNTLRSFMLLLMLVRNSSLKYAKEKKTKKIDKDERISGAEGALFMRKSGVPDSTLEKIWDLADAKRTGYLLHRDFAIAMRLIALVQEGKSPSLDQIHNVASMKLFVYFL